MVKKKMTIDDLAVMAQNEFAIIHKKLGKHSKYFNKIESRFDGIDSRFGNIESRLDGVDLRLDGVDSRLGNVESRLDGLDAKVDNVQDLSRKVLAALDENTTILRDMRDEIASTSSILVSHEKRITTLEEKVEVGK